MTRANSPSRPPVAGSGSVAWVGGCGAHGRSLTFTVGASNPGSWGRRACVANGGVGHGETEEAGKPDGLHARMRRLNRPSHGLAAHIDAEGRLHLDGRRGGGGLASAGEPLNQIALVSHFERALAHFVGHQLGIGLGQQQGDLMPRGLHGFEAALRCLIALAIEHQGAPGQPYREQIAQVAPKRASPPGAPGGPATTGRRTTKPSH